MPSISMKRRVRHVESFHPEPMMQCDRNAHGSIESIIRQSIVSYVIQFIAGRGIYSNCCSQLSISFLPLHACVCLSDWRQRINFQYQKKLAYHCVAVKLRRQLRSCERLTKAGIRRWSLPIDDSCFRGRGGGGGRRIQGT